MDAMWEYWRGKCGHVDAIQDYYPEQANDPLIAHALIQIEAAKLVIDARMKQLREQSS